MSVGNRIKKLRKDAGYSRVAFAEKIGIPHTTLRNYENDEREPGHNFLIMMANEFDVTVDYLLGIEKNEKTAPTTHQVAEAVDTLLYAYYGRPATTDEIDKFTSLFSIVRQKFHGSN